MRNTALVFGLVVSSLFLVGVELLAADEPQRFNGAESFEALNKLLADGLNAADYPALEKLLLPKEMLRGPLGRALGPASQYEAYRRRFPKLAEKFHDILKKDGLLPLKEPEIRRKDELDQTIAGRKILVAEAFLKGPKSDAEYNFAISVSIDSRWYVMFISSAKTLGDIPPGAAGAKPGDVPRNKPETPAGHVLLKDAGKLLPGMPVKYWLGSWKDAEFLAVREGDKLVLLVPVGRGGLRTFNHKLSDLLAVAEDVLKNAKENPQAYKPSHRLLPDGQILIPDDLQPLPKETVIVPGTPLFLEWGPFWHPVTVVKVMPDGQLEVQHDKSPHVQESQPRGRFTATEDVLHELQKTGAKKLFAPNAERARRDHELAERSIGDFEQSRLAAIVHQDSSMKPHPGYEKLKLMTHVPAGTPLKVAMSWTWHDVTAVEDTGPVLPVLLSWSDDTEYVDNRCTRDTIYIDKELQARLLTNPGAKSVVAKPEIKTKPEAKPERPARKPMETLGAGRYEIVLEKAGSQKIPLAKVVMEITGFEIKEAIEVLAETPITLKGSLTKSAAEDWKQKLEGAGATIRISAEGESQRP